MAEESKLQSKIRRSLAKKEWLICKIIICSVPGWPDIFAMKAGRSVWIEVKSKGKKARPLQGYVHKRIKSRGGEVFTVDSWEEYLKLKL